jgi:hypothetical protein
VLPLHPNQRTLSATFKDDRAVPLAAVSNRSKAERSQPEPVIRGLMNRLCCWGSIGGHPFLRSLYDPRQPNCEG